MVKEKVIIRKVWRSELPRLVLFVVLLVVAPVLSNIFGGSVITGELFSLLGVTYYLSLPLWWLVPAFMLLEVAWRIYNVRYVVDELGIESWDGILSLKQQITHVRHEDVRSIETDQSVLERILDVGEVQIATAATGGVEITFQGVPSPKKMQNWLQAKRDKVQKHDNQGSRKRALAGSSSAASSGVNDVTASGDTATQRSSASSSGTI